MAENLPTSKVADLAGVHRDTLLRWLRDGTVPEPHRDRHGWRAFTETETSAIVAFARGQSIPPIGTVEDGAIDRLVAVEWDFADAKTGYLTHGLHPYPAKYIPQIPNALIQELSSVGDTVADIFCGSGTSLLEALLLKRNAIGIDANPLAILISRAKTTPLNDEHFGQLDDHQNACRKLADHIEPQIDDLFYGGTPFRSNAWRPDADVCEFWFLPHVVEELAEIKRLIDLVPDGPARTLSMACFSAIIVTVSKQDSDTRYVRREKSILPGDTVKRYVDQLSFAITATHELTDLLEDRFWCKLSCDNILNGPNTGPFDLVVTSPPYPNAYSYHLYHRTRLIWLGYEPEVFKKIEIGSHRKYSSKGPNRADEKTFSQECKQIFKWLQPRLRDRGYACFVVGDSTLAGSRIDNASLLAGCAKDAGLREVTRINRTIASTRKTFNPAIGKIKTENILVLQKASS